MADRSEFELSGPFERDLTPHPQRVSVAFSFFLRMKGTRELNWAEDTAELGLNTQFPAHSLNRLCN